MDNQSALCTHLVGFVICIVMLHRRSVLYPNIILNYAMATGTNHYLDQPMPNCSPNANHKANLCCTGLLLSVVLPPNCTTQPSAVVTRYCWRCCIDIAEDNADVGMTLCDLAAGWMRQA